MANIFAMTDVINGSVLPLALNVSSIEKRVIQKMLELLSTQGTVYRGNFGAFDRSLYALMDSAKSFKGDVQSVMQKWMSENLGKMYGLGLNKAAGALGVKATWGVMHTEALKILQENVMFNSDRVTSQLFRNVHDVYYQMSMAGVSQQLAGGNSIDQTAKLIESKLRENGITSFYDKNKKPWSLASYATMAARTVSMQAYIHGSANKYMQEGVDLVRVGGREPEEGVSSDAAFKYFDQIVSLSGKTQGYPSLAEAESEGLLHPNNWRDIIPLDDVETAKAEVEGEVKAQEQEAYDLSHHDEQTQTWYDKNMNLADSACAKAIREPDSYYVENMQRGAKFHNMTVEEYVKQATMNQQKIIDAAAPKIGVSEDQLQKVLADGRYKTQFETKTSGGFLNNDYRAKAEEAFGLPSRMADKYRPVYGFMSDDSYTRVPYGKGQLNIVLNDSVRGRTTMTAGDSFGLLHSRGVAEVGRGETALDNILHLTGTTLENPYNADALKATNVRELLYGSYMEIQVHGGVALSDMAGVEIVEPEIIRRFGSIESFMGGSEDEYESLRSVLFLADDKGLKVTMGITGRS